MYGSPTPNHMLQEENHPPPNVEVGLHISTCLICFLCTSILSHNQRPRIWKTTRKNPERIREQLARIIVWSKVHMGSKGRKKKKLQSPGSDGQRDKDGRQGLVLGRLWEAPANWRHQPGWSEHRKMLFELFPQQDSRQNEDSHHVTVQSSPNDPTCEALGQIQIFPNKPIKGRESHIPQTY